MTLPIVLVAAFFLPWPVNADGGRLDGRTRGAGSYEDLIALFSDFIEWRSADMAFAATSIASRRAEMEKFQRRLNDMAVVDWDLHQQTDRKIREFLVSEDIITIPAYIGELDTNVPWIVPPDGPNFWEQVQFRDPTPDHLHAVIPEHRFDGFVEDHNTHPIRGRISSDARAEGWAVYVEEAMMNAGLLDDQPRVRELIYLFGILRAARAPADVWLQQNEMSVQEVVDWWMIRVPWLGNDRAGRRSA